MITRLKNAPPPVSAILVAKFCKVVCKFPSCFQEFSLDNSEKPQKVVPAPHPTTPVRYGGGGRGGEGRGEERGGGG